MNNVVERIIATFEQSNINIDDIAADYTVENNIDSITFIEMIINIEEKFSILVLDEYLIVEKLNTISKIAEPIANNL